ncbi:MAG: threonylcarbamoyl-AMP synthase [Prevotella sp.]|nr:threonylcarbamoyl-AMP synthase [Prevotella sp.]
MTFQDDIKNAIDVMRKGGVILYPTDTIWGIGCDATNAEAVARVYQIKKRNDSKALICLVDSDARLQRYVRKVPDVAWELIDAVVKPTTIIYDNAVNLAPNLVAEDGSIAIRITQEKFSQELCFRFQKPIVSTSANISGEPSAQNFCDISPEIIEAVDYVCWTRRQEHLPHTASSIIKLGEDGEVKIIRK